jgi:hypothetical protein
MKLLRQHVFGGILLALIARLVRDWPYLFPK